MHNLAQSLREISFIWARSHITSRLPLKYPIIQIPSHITSRLPLEYPIIQNIFLCPCTFENQALVFQTEYYYRSETFLLPLVPSFNWIEGHLDTRAQPPLDLLVEIFA
jgi:hypothetical protein